MVGPWKQWHGHKRVVKTVKLKIKMCDKIRPFQGASETTENGYKWSEKSEGYVFIPTIVDQNVKKTHPAGLENTAIPQFKIKITEIPHEKLANTAIPQTPMSPSY